MVYAIITIICATIILVIIFSDKKYSKGKRNCNSHERDTITISATSTCKLLNNDLDHILITFLRNSDIEEYFKRKSGMRQ